MLAPQETMAELVKDESLSIFSVIACPDGFLHLHDGTLICDLAICGLSGLHLSELNHEIGRIDRSTFDACGFLECGKLRFESVHMALCSSATTKKSQDQRC